MNYQFQIKCTHPEQLSAEAVQGLVLALERILENAGFDDIDTSGTATGVRFHGVLVMMPEGEIRVGKNELSVLTTDDEDGNPVEDPSAIRGGSKRGNSLTKLSGCVVRDSDGAEVETALVILGRDQSRRHLGNDNYSGEAVWLFRDDFASGTDDERFRKVMTMRSTGIGLHVPVYQIGFDGRGQFLFGPQGMRAEAAPEFFVDPTVPVPLGRVVVNRKKP